MTLVAASQDLQFEGTHLPGMTYNGNYSGPLLKTVPGGEMNVRLVNHLQEETNLHFHGILTSPLGRSDNMMIMVKPGKSFSYQVKISKAQTPGLYWYHVHTHTGNEAGVMGGLSGPLLVEGFAEKYVLGDRPAERVLVLKEYRDRRSDDPILRNRFHGRIMTINGGTNAALSLFPHERQLWHIGNFGPDRPLHLKIVGHEFTVVGRDGVPALRPMAVDSLTVNPGSRYEVFVDAGVPGTFSILASDDDGDGKGRHRERRRGARDGGDESDLEDSEQIGTLEVGGPPWRAGNLPHFRPLPAKDLSGARIDAFRTVVFGQTGRNYTLDGKTFDPARVDTRVPLGNIEQWTIKNDSDELHVFHIHQVNFQVTEINGQAQAFNGAVDTVSLPPFQSVTLRIAFTDPEIVGRFMYHCHVLEHEDRGMMAQIEVYDPRHRALRSTDSMGMRGLN